MPTYVYYVTVELVSIRQVEVVSEASLTGTEISARAKEQAMLEHGKHDDATMIEWDLRTITG